MVIENTIRNLSHVASFRFRTFAFEPFKMKTIAESPSYLHHDPPGNIPIRVVQQNRFCVLLSPSPVGGMYQ